MNEKYIWHDSDAIVMFTSLRKVQKSTQDNYIVFHPGMESSAVHRLYCRAGVLVVFNKFRNLFTLKIGYLLRYCFQSCWGTAWCSGMISSRLEQMVSGAIPFRRRSEIDVLSESIREVCLACPRRSQYEDAPLSEQNLRVLMLDTERDQQLIR